MTRPTAIHVTIPTTESGRGAALLALDRQLESLAPDGFAEIRVDHDEYPALFALVNGARAWAMCVRDGGDAGFSSRNPDYAGEPGEMVEYFLANGQRDVYPAAWAYPRSRVVEAVRWFARERRVPEWMAWSNDSGDGRASPNDR